MTIQVKHAFDAVKADGPDSTLVQPSNWNAAHTLTMANGKILGRTSTGSGVVEELSVSSPLTLAAGALGLANFTGDVTSVAGATTIADGVVSTAKLAATAVTTAKIAAGAVTTTELGADAVTNAKLADNAVQTENVKDSAITLAKIGDIGASLLIGRTSASTGTPQVIGLGAGLSMSGQTLSVTSATPGTGSVGQSQLKTSTSAVSVNISPSGFLHTAFAGGEYGFGPNVKVSASGPDSAGCEYPPSDAAPSSGGNISTSYANRVFISGDTEGGANAVFAQQRYVTASPPYDYGEGEMDAFVFAMLEKGTGNVLATWTAIDPPWAYNGPTKTKADAFKCSRSGALFTSVQSALGAGAKNVVPVQFRPKCSNTRKEAMKLGGAHLQQYLDELRSGNMELQAVTMARKMRDMAVLPHPFFSADPNLHEVVLLDPQAQLCRSLIAFTSYDEGDGDTAADLLHGGNIKIDNEDLKQTKGRKGPKGVMIVNCRVR